MPHYLSVHEALIYTMITMSAVDSEISDKELSRIGTLVKNLPVFEGFDLEQLTKVASECGLALGAESGLRDVLEAIGNAVPEKLTETAYALAVEVAIIDRQIEREEIRFLQMLRDRLNLDKLVTAALERGARARHRKI
ncbi:MAG: hypothetical protein DHS20C08_13500 [Rhodomicrobium sp.]|nr:MAG: hypothetical protein DHS20C08_13500 [Rhodomicrobium sp.]